MDSIAVTTITLFCTILATLIAWQTFKNKEVDDPDTEQQMLREKFELLLNLNHRIYDGIKRYCIIKSCFEDHFMQGLTFNPTLQILDRVKQDILSPENYELLNEKIPGPRVRSMMAHFNTQIKHHSEIDTYLRYHMPHDEWRYPA